MAGTKAGGRKAAASNYKKHGKDFYKRIGAKGGANGHTGGFAANPELARAAGRKGGLISKRGCSLTIDDCKLIKKLYNEGYLLTEIADRVNRHYITVKKVIDREGW